MEEVQCREALDIVGLTCAFLAGAVNIGDADTIILLDRVGKVIEYGGEPLAVTAPRGVELDQPWTGRIEQCE